MGIKSSDTKFIKYVAYLQIIGIILVVLGHSFHEYPDGSEGKSLLLYKMLYSFRMPLFMFTSGFLMVYTTFLRKKGMIPSVGKFAMTKVKRLLLPFVFLTLITYLPRALMSDMADDEISLSFDSLWKSIVYADKLIIPYMWFIQASFVLLVVSYMILYIGYRKKVREWILYTTLLLIFFILPYISLKYSSLFAINEVVRLGMYFMAGALYGRISDMVDRYIPWTSTGFLCMSVVVWVMFYFFTINTDYIFVCSFAGIIMCISLAKVIEARGITLLDHMIGANYLIFLLSWYFNVASQQVLHHYVELPWWCYTVISFLSGIYVPLYICRWLEYNMHLSAVRLLSTLLGQKSKMKHENPLAGEATAPITTTSVK